MSTHLQLVPRPTPCRVSADLRSFMAVQGEPEADDVEIERLTEAVISGIVGDCLDGRHGDEYLRWGDYDCEALPKLVGLLGRRRSDREYSDDEYREDCEKVFGAAARLFAQSVLADYLNTSYTELVALADSNWYRIDAVRRALKPAGKAVTK